MSKVIKIALFVISVLNMIILSYLEDIYLFSNDFDIAVYIMIVSNCLILLLVLNNEFKITRR